MTQLFFSWSGLNCEDFLFFKFTLRIRLSFWLLIDTHLHLDTKKKRVSLIFSLLFIYSTSFFSFFFSMGSLELNLRFFFFFSFSFGAAGGGGGGGGGVENWILCVLIGKFVFWCVCLGFYWIMIGNLLSFFILD